MCVDQILLPCLLFDYDYLALKISPVPSCFSDLVLPLPILSVMPDIPIISLVLLEMSRFGFFHLCSRILSDNKYNSNTNQHYFYNNKLTITEHICNAKHHS